MDVRFTDEAAAKMGRLPVAINARVQGVIRRLGRWPEVSGAKPLTGPLAGRYRIRTGDYRVQFYVRQNILWIEKIGHRDGFYGD